MTDHFASLPLVSTLWLHQNLGMPNLRIIDIRGHVLPASEPLPHYFSHRAAYDAAHLPGAVFVDWITDITIAGPAKMQIAPPETFAALMSKLGVDAQTFVVVYDDADGMFAARLWWALNYHGHTSAAVLDGGWQKWIAEDRPITDESPRIPVTRFEPKLNPSLRVTADEVAARLNTGTKLIDFRSADEFNGITSRAKRYGRLPGAINLPRATLTSADGVLLPDGVLQDTLLAADVNPEDHLVLYCNSGVAASYGMLALRAAGYQNITLYDGSWKDWGNDETRPVEGEPPVDQG